MGRKRKENYDDWWRCEICFEPELDELFGVNHSKQEINPTETLRTELSQHLEAIALALNSRVRAAFSLIKKQTSSLATTAEAIAASREKRLPTPSLPLAKSNNKAKSSTKRENSTTQNQGLRFKITTEPLDVHHVYVWNVLQDGTLLVTINENHSFFDQVYCYASNNDGQVSRQSIDSLILAMARAEVASKGANAQEILNQHRGFFSNILASYLGD